MKQSHFILLFALITVLIFTSAAMAHKVNIFAYVGNKTVYIEGYFPDGQPVIEGEIAVFDSNGEHLLRGKTDSKGLFSFPLPAEDDLTIEIKASMGHRAKFILRKNDLLQ